MKIKKFSGGGVQFSPASVNYATGVISVLGQTQNTNSSSSASSLFSSGEKGAIGLLNKTMSDALIKDTLPNEAQYIINNTDIFGQYIDPNDPSSASAMYAEILQSMQIAKYNKEIFNDAITKARDRQALKGPAINTDGTVWVKTEEGLKKRGADEVKPGDALLTVAELAQLRAYNPNFAFNEETISTIENATSMKEIQDFINSVIRDIGKEEYKFNLYGTKSELMSLPGIFEGIGDVLRGTSSDGIYKGTIEHSSNTDKANSLLSYLYKVLDPNQRAYLEVISRKWGIDVRDEKTGQKINGVYVLLREFVQGKYNTKTVYDADFQKDQTRIVFGKEFVGEEDKDKLENMKTNPALNFFNETGQKEGFRMQLGSWEIYTVGTVSNLFDSKGHALGWTSMSQVATSMFAPILDISQAHFGGAKISDRDKIQVDGSKIVNLYLPVDLEAKARNETRPDFNLLEKATALQRQTAGMTDVNQINQVYQRAGFPSLFVNDGQGNITLNARYARFAAMHAFADRKVIPDKDVLGNPLEFDNTIQEVDDDSLAETVISRFKQINKGYSESRTGGFLGAFTHPDLYQGMVFIPLLDTPINAMSNARIKDVNRIETARYKQQSNQKNYNSETVTIKPY